MSLPLQPPTIDPKSVKDPISRIPIIELPVGEDIDRLVQQAIGDFDILVPRYSADGAMAFRALEMWFEIQKKRHEDRIQKMREDGTLREFKIIPGEKEGDRSRIEYGNAPIMFLSLMYMGEGRYFNPPHDEFPARWMMQSDPRHEGGIGLESCDDLKLTICRHIVLTYLTYQLEEESVELASKTK